MLRPGIWQLVGTIVLLATGVARAAEEGQPLLQEAMEVKLSAESLADLNQVIKLCQDAIDKGLAEDDVKFAEELLASTLSQRAELVCHELFERRVTPSRGQALLRMALSDLTKTTELNPEQPEAQFLLGRLYAHLGEKDKARAALDQAVRLAADDPSAKSKALMIRGNLQEDAAQRQADLDEAVKLTPKDAEVLRFRGMNYLTANNVDAAISDFNAAIELDPKNAETYEARGMAEASVSKLDEALVSFDKAIELEPKSPGALTHRARVRAMKGDLPAALSDVEQSMKLQPASQSLLLHASLLAASGKFEQALGELNVLRQVMPDSPDVLLQVAAVHQATKQPEKAIEAYNHLIAADPQNAAALRGRGDVHLNQGQQTAAIADYEEALKFDDDNSGVLNNLAWVLATSTDDKLRDGKRAIELATEACKVTDFKQAHILSTLAASYAEAGDFDAAIDWSQKAVAICTDHNKEQLGKELESYQAKKPWREATPPQEPAAEATAQPESDTAPAEDETARAQARNLSVDRGQAWQLVCEYTASDSLRKHMLAVEAAMRAYARRYGEDENTWGIVGLLHDFDYERWPDPPDHPLQGAAILAERGYPPHVIYAIKSHADYLTDCPRVSRLDKTLYACDELSGFITACAKVRPEGIVGLKAASVRKKLKAKGFAAAVNREDITSGAADLGVELDEHIQFVIDALAAEAEALGLRPAAG